MTEYIDNGTELLNVGDQIRIGINNVGYSPSIRAAVVFEKSGLYEVSRSLSGNYITITNVTPQSKTCDGCKHDPSQKPEMERSPLYIPERCVCCVRRCVDHYEMEEE